MHRQFLWIMTDTTGFNMLGCYGNALVSTPCLDRMAEGGMRFERAYTTQPVCGPARSSLFTGMYPHSNGSWGNSMPLGANVLTLGQRLSREGVHCAYIGKWHLDGGDYFGNGVCPDGWEPEYWYDMKNYLDELTDDEKLASRRFNSNKGDDVERDMCYASRVTRRALDFIEKHKDEDYFLVVSYDEPHGPCMCPAPYNKMYADAPNGLTPAHFDTLEDKPLYQRLWAKGADKLDRNTVRAFNRPLCRCNSYVDSEIGRVLDARKAYSPESMCLYTSDHGDAMNAHCLSGKGPSVYDEIARIPLIFTGPGVPVGVYPHTVSHIDLPATVLDYMGLRRPNCFEGTSLLPQIRGDMADTGRPAFVEFGRYEIDHDGFGGFQPMRAAVTDRYKLALHLTDTDELYDESNDPFDMHNLISDEEHAPVRNELHDAILGWMNNTRDPFRGYQWKCRPWRPEYAPSWDVDGYTRQRDNDPGEPRQLDYDTGLPMVKAVRHKDLS